MIKHIIKLIWNQRRRNAWIAAELLLVFVVLWYIVDSLLVISHVFYSPLGYDIDHVYLVKYGVENTSPDAPPAGEEASRTIGSCVALAAERIRNCPGVETVGVGYIALPMSGANIYSAIHCGDSTSGMVNRKCVMAGYMDVFRFQVQEPAGVTWEQVFAGKNIVVSNKMYEKLKKKGLTRDNRYTTGFSKNDDDTYSIGAVTAPFRASRFHREATWYFQPITPADLEGLDVSSNLSIVLRVRPDADTNFADTFMETMTGQLDIGRIYLIDIVPYTYQRDSYELLDGEMNRVKNMIAGMAFLLFNIFLGIVGTFWYRTQQRKSEMGLRVALGSTPGGLRQITLLEGLLLLTLLAIPAGIICINIGYMEIVEMGYMDFTFPRFLAGFGLTFLALALMITIGIWYPATRISRIEPAEALHDE